MASQSRELKGQDWHPLLVTVTFRRACSILAGRVQRSKKFSLFLPMVIPVLFLHLKMDGFEISYF